MKNKISLTIFFSLMFIYGHSQSEIDTSNYFNYYTTPKDPNLRGTPLMTGWLNIDEVVPIIMDEMKKAGYEWLYSYPIYKTDSNQYIRLTTYSRKSNFGFLYIQGHVINPQISYRTNRTEKDKNRLGAEYMSCTETAAGKMECTPIMKLPSNILVLNENCYWYQQTNNKKDDKYLVTKEAIINVLRQDIRALLKRRT